MHDVVSTANMHNIPDCLRRRYQVLDELVDELASVTSSQDIRRQTNKEVNDASIKLMCEFWNILKEDPDCNLTKAVRERMGLDTKTSFSFRPHRMSCYMAEQEEQHPGEKKKETCCVKSVESTKQNEKPDSKSSRCCSSKSISPKSTNEAMPLSKVLCNLKEAVSFDKKCNARISELVQTQKLLQEQIQQLEEREKEGTEMLKEAECMWSCMEAAYKTKVKESLERQSSFLKQMKEIETSNTKWRKNKKDLENQIVNINKCCKDIKEKYQEKNNDAKCIRMEIDDFKKRIENNTKQVAAVKKSLDNKKKASDVKVAGLSAEMTKMRKVVADEQNYKKQKEQEGSKYIKEAREDLQKIYRLLLEKKLENEDLRAEKQTLLQELDLLKKTCEQCKDKCQGKEKTILDELAKVDAEIAGYKVRCIKCHQCTDTADVRKFCVDCPRCVEQRDCLYKDGYCCQDTSMDCVCMSTKEKFMDNVFDNMYSVLEKQIKSSSGKTVANAVLDCLKKSRNGKLNESTRKKLQEFILTSVKKNLDLTIVGGAVKTRCEMDSDTYNQLMLCLKLVKSSKPPKEDKGTVPKKEPCPRWGGTSECNCPKGPKGCICTKKGLPDPNDLESCPTKDKDDAGEKIMCPHKDLTAPCGSDCAIQKEPSAVGKEVASWMPDSCNDKKCTFSKNMRAAQCVLGPDSLLSGPNGFRTKVPFIPDVSVLEDQIVCKCGTSPTKPCPCKTDTKRAVKCTEDTCDLNQEKPTSSDSEHMFSEGFINKSEKSKTAPERKKLQSNTQTKQAKLQKMKENLEKFDNTPKFEEKSKKLYNKRPTGKPDKKLIKENVHFKSQVTHLTKTPSGTKTMEFDADTVKEIEKELKKRHEIRATISKTDSGHFIVNFHSTESSYNNIFVFKKSPSGCLLMEMVKSNVSTAISEGKGLDPVADILNNTNQNKSEQSFDGLEHNYIRNHETMVPNQAHDTKVRATSHQKNKNITSSIVTKTIENNKSNIYKLLIKDIHQDLDCPLAVLKETKSNNYILSVDKEYERPFKKTMREHFGSDFECPLKLSKQLPGSIIVDFLENKDNVTPNALLTRSNSGNIKICTDLKRLSNQFDIRKSFSSQGKRASVVFSNMINPFTPVLKEKSTEARNLKDKKSCSDSNLLQKVRMKLQNQHNLLSESSVLLKKTSSGQYAVILNKDSKKSFINNLKQYVSSSSQGTVPIKRTDNGEIVIMLNNETNENSKYDSLKITPSGNIYVMVDESYLKNISNKSKNILKPVNKGNNTVRKVESKNVTTTCNARPDSCDCNPRKCACEDVLSHGVDGIRFNIDDTKCVKSFKFCSVEDSHYDCKKFKCHYKNPNKYLDSFSKTDADKPRDKSPHIVIRQCSCRPNSHNESINNDEQQLFYISQSVCPFHKDRYETVSNELLEISGLCNNPQKMENEDKDYEHTSKSIYKSSFKKNYSDHLKFLPPQLPSFLSGYRYD